MAFGSSSAIFVQALINPIMQACWTTAVPTGYTNLSANTLQCALYNDTCTPDKLATQANTCYGAGTWSGNEVTGGASPWQAKGATLSGKAFAVGTGTPPTNVVWFDAADAGGAGNVTITGAMGCMIFNDTTTTPVDIGLCYLAFGSAQGVSGGTFTVVFDNTGVFKVSV